MYIGLHAKYPLFLSDVHETRIFLEEFSKNTQISNFMKILPVEAELFHADGQTGMARLIVAIRNCVNQPQKTFMAALKCMSAN
jgi:hypothetical protein